MRGSVQRFDTCRIDQEVLRFAKRREVLSSLPEARSDASLQS